MTGAAAPRIGPLPVARWTEEERALLRGNLARADRYLSGAADAPPMPSVLGLFARHPRVGAPWLAFSGALLDDGALDARDRELLILRVGHRTNCRYQWTQHVGPARAAGLTREHLAAVAEGSGSPVWDERDRDLLRAADRLVDDHTVDEDTWKRLAARFDERQLLELLFVVGSYVCLAMVLNGVGLEPAAGSDPDADLFRGPAGGPAG
ncbi:carboxymuconolactone decarboxylase family protein [Actinomadura algeriensis]|uniref:AhpD family alkylhydroperoxidase n=1 Tax=Actinomadura algeriensis TaxID=1679523 RepID=A0ABR9K1Q7_9ACTN|nr:carboxymuconolactone decarboxylase family protein [Actinomadura algeriensis]MBE1536771.1 AhpD family alkylhydroperoxidase [Actinomadura algeriensis]